MSTRVPRRVAASFAPRAYEGSLDAAGLRLGVVCARWNPTVTDAMLRRALDALRRHGARAADVIVARVPGAFELPGGGARPAGRRQDPDALVALGGDRPRRDHAPRGSRPRGGRGARRRSRRRAGSPIGFGVLTCDTMEQARARTGKGVEAAEAAIEMANLRRHSAERVADGRPAQGSGARASDALRERRRRDRARRDVPPLRRSPEGPGGHPGLHASASSRGRSTHREDLDAIISRQADHWRLARMPVVDRNILRLALFELLHEPETPRPVVIDEALEIAKRFSTPRSSQFINGILDGVLKSGAPRAPTEA